MYLSLWFFWSMDISSDGDEYSLLYFIKIKRPADLSIVERLGGFLWCKGKAFIWIVQGFWGKNAEMEVVFNRCWVFQDAKCGICKPKWVDYKPYCTVRRIGTNFVASLWTSGRADCEVEAGIYEVWFYGKRRGATFGASMSAGRILKSPIIKRVREEKDFGTMNRKDFCGLMSFRVEFGRIVARFGRYARIT